MVESLYLRAFVSMSSFSKSLRRDLKTFLDVSPVFSLSSWRVNSPPSFKVAMTCSSVLLSFTMCSTASRYLCVMAFWAFSILRYVSAVYVGMLAGFQS